jgi:hypothetical protein
MTKIGALQENRCSTPQASVCSAKLPTTSVGALHLGNFGLSKGAAGGRNCSSHADRGWQRL